MTLLGRILCVLYALCGIPITILLLKLLGQYVMRGQRSLITAFETRCLGRRGPPSRLNEKCLALCFIELLLLLFTVAAAQMLAEDWSFTECLYFYVISSTTVSFGDYYAQHGRYITISFIFLGLTAVSSILHAASSLTLVKHVTKGSDESEGNEKPSKV